jgi:DNA mismatch repair protein MutS
VDRTVTPGGARLLAERLAGPLTDVAAIRRRQDAVAFLVEDGILRDRVRSLLKATPDIARALSRLGLGRGGPRDLAALKVGLVVAREAGAALARATDLPHQLAAAARRLERLDPGLAERLAAALADELPLLKRDGGFVREGYRADLDEARELQQDSRRFIAGLQARYAAETGCRTCGSSTITCSATSLSAHRPGEEFLKGPERSASSTARPMAEAMRSPPWSWASCESRIAGASDRALRIELGCVRRAVRRRPRPPPHQRGGGQLRVVDVTAALAELARGGA